MMAVKLEIHLIYYSVEPVLVPYELLNVSSEQEIFYIEYNTQLFNRTCSIFIINQKFIVKTFLYSLYLILIIITLRTFF